MRSWILCFPGISPRYARQAMPAQVEHDAKIRLEPGTTLMIRGRPWESRGRGLQPSIFAKKKHPWDIMGGPVILPLIGIPYNGIIMGKWVPSIGLMSLSPMIWN